MLKFNCVKCEKPINEAGALIFSPPFKLSAFYEDADLTAKYHICKNCFALIYRFMKEKV